MTDTELSILMLCLHLLISTITALHLLLFRQNQPTSTAFWLVLIYNLPIFGFLLYLFFGITRFQTRSQRAAEKATEATDAEDNAAYYRFLKYRTQHIDPMKTPWNQTLNYFFPDQPLTQGHELRLYQDGTNLYPAMLKAIHHAQHHIHLESYILMNDRAGRKIMRALWHKACEGVKVRIIYDRLGSRALFSSPVYRAWGNRSGNLQIHAFSKLNLLTPYRIQLRNHRKLMIIDGHTAFTGGTNICADSDAKSRPKHLMHDLHAKLTGPVVADLQQIFLQDWLTVSKDSPALMNHSHYFPELPATGDSAVRVIHSGPGTAPGASETLFLSAASEATRSLWIMSPYFIPTQPLLKSLQMAAARGVDVRIIVPSQSDHWYVTAACRSYYNNLLDHDIRVFENPGNFNHAKAMLIDGEWAIIGSSNCDYRSFQLNYELDLVIKSESFVKELSYIFGTELACAKEITQIDLDRLPWQKQLIRQLCALLSPVL